MIVAKDLRKSLGSGPMRCDILRGISLTIDAGHVTLLMGPSGGGKSTLLSVLGLMQRPDSGDIFVAGQSMGLLGQQETAAVRRQHIGYVFQSFNLFPGLSARQNVALGLAVRGITGDKARRCAESALASVGLQNKSAARPGMLSGGEQQRVAIARAIVADTSIVLADEPTASLDSENGHQVLSILRTLAHGSRRAVVIVTHDARAIAYADRVLTMVDGRLASEPATASLHNRSGAEHGRVHHGS